MTMRSNRCFARPSIYRPEFPNTGSANLEAARHWAAAFVQWYNHHHRHSGTGYVSPAQRHAVQDVALFQARHALYQHAARRIHRAGAGRPETESGPARLP
ncbi:hypothetical protein C9397_10095 [Xanthomonas vasicola pv. vasculorum]|uniref:Integrase catalytic domain-containing protein n=1 Tax=Xanthomonas vasicola pv. vasculorum TaxID=325776 RepID=A0AAE8F6Y5_XANVA|nr:hypothetical protein C7V42_12300 [Xanthomonas vasicola pv. vasculorum]TWQ17734.1 transposase [Xanthomonas vasicola]AZM71478.1 hypothetical protein CXP37_12310 [Xanthomonas vasicola pv. vasculorum]OWF60386.1 hypothetical protein B1H41_13895 [Xanthomonas vasicola pv. vasculorum]PDM35441.1 hypothetical protein CQW50_05410 [Xanthomonas vasicola pv. vasculorum]